MTEVRPLITPGKWIEFFMTLYLLSVPDEMAWWHQRVTFWSSRRFKRWALKRTQREE